MSSDSDQLLRNEAGPTATERDPSPIPPPSSSEEHPPGPPSQEASPKRNNGIELEQEHPKDAEAGSKDSGENTDDARLAAAAAAAPLLADFSSKRDLVAARTQALLNPPRQREPTVAYGQQAEEQAYADADAAAHYQSAMIQFQSSLTSLQQKINYGKGQITAQDLELMYNQFETFMHYHPIYSPAARRARALAAAGTFNTFNIQHNTLRQDPSQSKKKKRTRKNGSAAKGQPAEGYSNMYTSARDLAAAGLPSNLVSLAAARSAPGATAAYSPWIGGFSGGGSGYPPFLGSQSMSQHSAATAYAPQMSQEAAAAAGGRIPGPEDSAAIARATAAAMANANAAAVGPGLDNQSALSLLQALTAMGYGGEDALRHLDQHMQLGGDADELAASALMALGSQDDVLLHNTIDINGGGGNHGRGSHHRGNKRDRSAAMASGKGASRRGAPGEEPPARRPRALSQSDVGEEPIIPNPGAVPPAPEIDKDVETQLLALLVSGLVSK